LDTRLQLQSGKQNLSFLVSGFSVPTHGGLKKFAFPEFGQAFKCSWTFQKATWEFEKLQITSRLFQKLMLFSSAFGRLEPNGCQHQLYATVAWEHELNNLSLFSFYAKVERQITECHYCIKLYLVVRKLRQTFI